MRTYIADMTEENTKDRVLIAYYLLFSEDLQCVEQRTSPSLGYMQADNVFVVVCEDEDEVVGVMCVQDGAVMYPVLAENYTTVLRELVSAAYEFYGSLYAITDNELILETAVSMDIGVERNGNRLELN